jgi:hypothetical protein
VRMSHIILVYYQLLIKNEVFSGNQPSLDGMDGIHSILTRPTTQEECIAFTFLESFERCELPMLIKKQLLELQCVPGGYEQEICL